MNTLAQKESDCTFSVGLRSWIHSISNEILCIQDLSFIFLVSIIITIIILLIKKLFTITIVLKSLNREAKCSLQKWIRKPENWNDLF